MQDTFKRVAFYFLRHGETDHNVYRVYEDATDIALNAKGVDQAKQVEKMIRSIPILSVCSSPMLRAQQTKDIVVQGKNCQTITLDGLRECESQLWRLFLALEIRELTPEEWAQIHAFTYRVEQALHQVMEQEQPTLVVAHGGIYWAIAHLLQLPGSPKVDNCHLLQIYPQSNSHWGVRSVDMDSSMEFFEERPADFNDRLEVATVFMECDNNRWLLLRCLDKISPGTWAIPGGKLEAQETPLEGLLRELEEELQVQPDPQELRLVNSLYVKHPLMHYKLHLFCWKLHTLPEICINQKEHQNFQWQSIDHIHHLPLLEGQFRAFQSVYR